MSRILFKFKSSILSHDKHDPFIYIVYLDKYHIKSRILIEFQTLIIRLYKYFYSLSLDNYHNKLHNLRQVS